MNTVESIVTENQDILLTNQDLIRNLLTIVDMTAKNVSATDRNLNTFIERQDQHDTIISESIVSLSEKIEEVFNSIAYKRKSG